MYLYLRRKCQRLMTRSEQRPSRTLFESRLSPSFLNSRASQLQRHHKLQTRAPSSTCTAYPRAYALSRISIVYYGLDHWQFPRGVKPSGTNRSHALARPGATHVIVRYLFGSECCLPSTKAHCIKPLHTSNICENRLLLRLYERHPCLSRIDQI